MSLGHSTRKKGRRRGSLYKGVWYTTATEVYRAVRQEIIKALGGKCERCGFEDWRALQADHIIPCGSHGHFTNHRLLADIKLCSRQGIKKYQCLCANCNWIKRYENNETNYGKSRVSANLSSGDSVHSVNTKTGEERVN